METDSLLQILACPRCQGDLVALDEAGRTQGLACKACKSLYPVHEDIPVMLVEEAQDLDAWLAAHPAAAERA